MIRLGMLDFDTSHVVEFARRLNHAGIEEEQWVDGASVVVGCPGESLIMPERIPGFTQAIAELGIPLVDQPEDMLGRVDGMLIESSEGGVHLRRARPFLEAGLPCFIDKPFTCGVADALRLAELAETKKAPIFSASSLRYAPEIVDFLADPAHGRIDGAVTYGPAIRKERNPGLFHYTLHAVEILYTLFGPGCERVSCVVTENADLVTAFWKDGRTAQVRGLRNGKPEYGCVIFAQHGAYPFAIGTQFIYRELLKQVVRMFESGRPPMDIRVTVEMMAFMEAANRSAEMQGGIQAVRLF